jgi:ankyrin repeat protein
LTKDFSRILFQRKLIFNICQQEGRTALIYAASLGSLSFIPLLLKCGADLNAEDNEKATALHWAAREGRADVCLELIEQVYLRATKFPTLNLF